MKEVVVDIAPKCIKGLEFGALSAKDIVAQSEVEIQTRDLYDLEKGEYPKSTGPLILKWEYHQMHKNVLLVMVTWPLVMGILVTLD